MSDLEDEIERRRQALNVLEEDIEDLIGDRRRSREKTRFEGDEQLNNSDDDIDLADQIARASSSEGFSTLSNKVALRNQKWQQDGAIAPYVRINPQSANQGTLGGQQPVLPNGQLIQVTNWGSASDTESTTVTVTLAPVQQIATQKVSLKTFRPYGVIQFGNRAASVKAEVDIGTGVQLTVSASSVIVQVGLDPSITDPADTTNIMLLSGMLSFLPIERETPIVRTRYLDNAPMGSTSTFVVPPFAINAVFWRDTIGEAVTLSFLDRGGDILYTYPIGVNAVMLTPVPLAGDVVAVSVTDTGGGGIAHGRLIFQLSF